MTAPLSPAIPSRGLPRAPSTNALDGSGGPSTRPRTPSAGSLEGSARPETPSILIGVSRTFFLEMREITKATATVRSILTRFGYSGTEDMVDHAIRALFIAHVEMRDQTRAQIRSTASPAHSTNIIETLLIRSGKDRESAQTEATDYAHEEAIARAPIIKKLEENMIPMALRISKVYLDKFDELEILVKFALAHSKIGTDISEKSREMYDSISEIILDGVK